MKKNNLRQIRKRKKLTMSKLSLLAEVNYSSLSRWEKNWCMPTIQTAEKLAKALNVEVNDLFPEENLKNLGG